MQEPAPKIENLTTDKTPISDACLIKWLQENHNTIGYMIYTPGIDPYKRKEKISDLIQKLDSGKKLHEQKPVLLNLWKEMIGNAIVFLKSQDEREKHHDAEDYGVNTLHSFFDTFCKFEYLLYGANENYRDHVSHMFRVYLLGHSQIDQKLEGFDIIDIDQDEKLLAGKKITKEEKEAMWCIIALTHDLGYALNAIDDINEKVRDMLNEYGNISFQEMGYTLPREPSHDALLRLMSSNLDKKVDNEYFTHLQSKYYLKYCSAFEAKNHGMISAILLFSNLVYFLESDYTFDSSKPLTADDARNFLIRSNILKSVAAHDCGDIYYLTLPQFPFLLWVFDDMQQWSRPQISDLFNKDKLTSDLTINELTANSISYEIEIRGGQDFDDEQKRAAKEKIEKWFAKSTERIRRVLRSAVGGELRELKLTYTLDYKVADLSQTLQIIHTNPTDVKLKIDGVEMSLYEFLNQD